jgi:hypothetical protein
VAKKEWTVMVYMAADNSDNEYMLADLSIDASSDLYEMMTVGSQPHADVVVQVDWKKPKGAERIHILPNGWEQLQHAPEPINVGAPAQLEDFVGWAQKRFPAKHYFLILWGHSFRYAFGFDGGDALSFKELSDVLDKHNVDILGFDSCGMSAIESAYQLRRSVDLMLASEIGMPLQGWPYDRILQALTRGMSPQELGQAVVREFVTSYPDKTIALTLLNLKVAGSLLSPMQALASSLDDAVQGDDGQREEIFGLFRDAAVPKGEPMVDLRALCRNLTVLDVDARVREAADALNAALAEGKGFVVVHGRRGAAAEGLGGVSAYAPHVGMSRDDWLDTYDDLDLSRNTTWRAVIRSLALGF